MNFMLQKVADALKAANDELNAIVRYNVRNHNWEVWVRHKPVEINFKNHDEAENRCEELNYEYAARKAVEALLEPNKTILDLIDDPANIFWSVAIKHILKCPTS